VHDDYVLADSLTALLDRLEWFHPSETIVIEALDPLRRMKEFTDLSRF
jgi:hypothetical protein